jgi:hypothetical protein
VGSYQNIQISVTDGQATASLTAFSINVVATTSGAATLSWMPPTQNTDGTALTDLANYKIYWGTSQNNFTAGWKMVPSSAGTTAIIDQLTAGTYYFVVTALDSSGNESAYSNVASKTVL